MTATRKEAGVVRAARAGGPVYVKYLDHVHFQNGNPSLFKPLTLEAVGWLVDEDEESLRLVLDRIDDPDSSPGVTLKTSGLVILKKTIIERRRL